MVRGYGPHNGYDHEVADRRYDPYARVGEAEEMAVGEELIWRDERGELMAHLIDLRSTHEAAEVVKGIRDGSVSDDPLGERPDVSPWEMWAVIAVILVVCVATCAGMLWGLIAVVS